MIKPGHQKFSRATQKWNTYTFHNLRDFSRTSEDNNQKQNWIRKDISINKINSLTMYINPFALNNMVGHTILCFGFSDWKEICLSVEWEQKIGKNYSFLRAFFFGYRVKYVRWTKKDTLNLRTKLRKDPIFGYPIHINNNQIKILLKDLIQETNASKNTYKKYTVFNNNCTSAVRNIARKHFPIPKRHYSLLLASFLPKFLEKLGVLDRKEKQKIGIL